MLNRFAAVLNPKLDWLKCDVPNPHKSTKIRPRTEIEIHVMIKEKNTRKHPQISLGLGFGQKMTHLVII